MNGTAVSEQARVFECGGEELSAILHRPATCSGQVGVVLIVGGPQYRVGSHRQFVQLARTLAAAGVPVLRFDYRGMGDSSGALHQFEQIESDIAAAVDHAAAAVPEMRGWVLWGLCDAASAAAFYAFQDARICGLVLLNPWVRTEAGAAQATLKHYYIDRLRQPDFWRKLLRLEWNPLRSFKSLGALLRRSRTSKTLEAGPDWRSLPLPQRMHYGLERFNGPVLLVLSGRDLTAQEFEDVTRGNDNWQGWWQNESLTIHRLPDSDHTFSKKVWSEEVERITAGWIAQL